MELVGGAAGLGAEIVARLVGCNRKQPGAKAPLWIEELGALMHLEESFLEEILGGGAVSDESDEEMEQLALIPIDEDREGGAVALPIRSQKLLVSRRRDRK